MKTSILPGIITILLLLCCTLSASASEEFTLDIFGNANEDDTIDMQDVEYTEQILLKYSNETELADAKYDNSINILDVTQVELIMLGQDKELTIIDEADRTVTVYKPIGRVITLGGYDAEIMWLIGAQDKIVGIASWMAEKSYYGMCMPELTELPTVGSGTTIDFEAVLGLNPDLVITWHYYIANFDEKIPESIPAASFDLFVPESLTEGVVKFGYIFGKRDEAEHYIDDFHDKNIDSIKVRTEGLSEEERPKVYLERHDMPYKTYGSDSYVHQGIHIAGGKNIFAEEEAGQFVADPEDVATKNPDIIIKYASSVGPEVGYGADGPSHTKAIRDEIMSRPELAEVNAVKDGRVYIMYMGLNCGPGYPIANAYWAKWFQPELFLDLDPNGIHKEYLNSQGIEFNLDEHGVFVYHPGEHPDGT